MEEERKAAMDKLFEVSRQGPISQSAAGLNALANALWMVGRDNSQTDEERMMTLCLLAGMATAALSDCADRLEEEE